MNFNFYQYRLGKAELEFGEMHASVYDIKLDSEFRENKLPFVALLKMFLLKEFKEPSILRNHLQRGFNLQNNKRTILVNYPNFPLKKIEKGNLISKDIELGLKGGDIGFYKPNVLEEKYYYFYETKHPFSQWHKSNFVVDNIEFSSAEQFMMYNKAILFSDIQTANKILKTKNVREQKALGRQVANFDLNIWVQKSMEIVYKGNKAKFKQNKEYLELLISTNGKTIVEASPTDSIWGIGLLESDEKSKNIMKWKGTNFLGIVLTELREELNGNGNEDKNGYWNLKDYRNNKEIKNVG